MRIVADGYVLRPWTDADVPALVEECRDPEIVRWLPNIPQPYTDADARSFIAHASESASSGDRAEFAIVDEHDVLLGSAGMRLREIPPSIGYWVAGSARGRGIATAATRGTDRVGVRDARRDEDRPLRRARQPRIAACGGQVRIRAGARRSQT